jgi:hypothetical protein
MSRNERITAQIPAREAQKSHHYGVKYTKYFSYRQKVEKKNAIFAAKKVRNDNPRGQSKRLY